MKYIELAVRQRKYHMAQSDIKRMYLAKQKKRPILPIYEEDDPLKMYSPAVTEPQDLEFCDARD